MLPGKTYKPEDIVQVLRRRGWVLLLPVALISAATALVVGQLPNRYRSQAMIMIVPQGVTDGYVMPAVTRRVEDRLPGIAQQILSRSQLEPIIREFGLYNVSHTDDISEALIERVRLDIWIQAARGNAFHVSFTGDDPHTVKRVADRLVSSVIRENVVSRSNLAQGTSEFLEAQLEDSRRRLIEHEEKLEVFRRKYSNELPSQVASNLQVLQNTQLQIQSVNESINHDRERRLVLERQLADARAEAAQPIESSSTTAGGGAPTSADELAAARATLAGLEQRFKETHPDIGIWRRRVRNLEAKVAAEAAAEANRPPPPPSPSVPATRAKSQAQRRVDDLEAEIALLDRQMAGRNRDESRLRSEAGAYQARVEMAPARESEMVELTRDYDTLQRIYANLLGKKEEAKIAANLEERQIGEQLRLVDPPRLPEKPFSPNRERASLLGFLGGLAVGIGLIVLLEYRDTSFRTDDEVISVLALPVLAVVPVMASNAERRRDRVHRWALGVGLGSTVVLCAAVVVFTLAS
jgi:polysaccharide chain length determinant protein (PEP-CTERM system associated)